MRLRPPTSKEQLDKSARGVEVAFRRMLGASDTTELKKYGTEAQHAWLAYRDAEVALYDHALGAKHPPDRVRGAIRLRLDKLRISDLRR